MKAILAMFGAALLCAAAAGQAAPVFSIKQNVASDNFAAQTLKKGAWEFGVLAGGGAGLGKSDDTQFVLAGGRLGYVLTRDHLPGWLRGNFQWTVDLMPILTVFPPQGPIYGGGFKPVIWQWNFTSHKKFVPYFSADGGILFSARNVPPGDTSYVNFMPGASLG
ncbi:MAG: hypothetical protein WA660_16435, partial [Candidatus Acidiferrales bacterium]